MRRSFLLGVIAVLVLEAIIAALVITTGVIDVAATKRPVVDSILSYASTSSIAHHASSAPNPLAHDPTAMKRGLQHYRDDCIDCHGAPGVHAAGFAAGLHPPPPDLASHQVQSFTDGMLYQTIAGGIGSTGMPAFGPSRSRDDIWSLVTFLRHLPELTPSEKEALGGPEAGGQKQAGAGSPAAAPPAATTAPSGPDQNVQQVTISGFKYVPPMLTVHVGDAVEWKNEDFVAHTATADDRSFDTDRIDPGQTKRLTMTRKGRFPYFCRYHVYMKGTIVVE